MTSWRTTVALVSAIALFHLTVGWGGSACLMPPVDATVTVAAATPAPVGDHEHHGSHALATDDSGDATSARDVATDDAGSSGRASHTPSHDDSRGCAAAAPCAVAVATVGRTALPHPYDGAEARPERRTMALSSVALAPELPPPRA